MCTAASRSCSSASSASGPSSRRQSSARRATSPSTSAIVERNAPPVAELEERTTSARSASLVRAGRLDGLASGGRGVHAALAFVLELESPAGLGELGAGHAQPLGRSVATIVQRVEPLEREVRRRQEPVGQNRRA
jgi:hypothetical protein